MENISRRNLLRAAGITILVPVFAKIFWPYVNAYGAEIPADYRLADPAKDAVPKSMQYTHDAKKAAARKDPKAFCRACIQYGKTHAEFAHPKDGKTATCEIFPNDKSRLYVKNGGWCLGFVKKS
jgi:hypothetical protein